MTPTAGSPSGSSETRSLTAPARSQRAAAPSTAGARSSLTRVVASSSSTSTAPGSGSASRPTFARAWSKRFPPRAPRIVTWVAPRWRAARSASSASDSSLTAGDRSIATPRAATSAKRTSGRESASPTSSSGARPSVAALSQPPSAATTSSTSRSQPGQPASSAARLARSPSATISACTVVCPRLPWRSPRRSVWPAVRPPIWRAGLAPPSPPLWPSRRA